MSQTELNVICKNCGREVSPYVTECPYCGVRLRKRAPKLEQRDGLLERKEPRINPMHRLRAQKSRLGAISGARPYATILIILVSAATILVQRAAGLSLYDLGAIVGSVDGDWWRFLTASFVYEDIGYLFVIAVIIAIFGSGVERRLGRVPALLLLFACGALGMIAGYGIETAIGEAPLAAGGNAIALGAVTAWLAIRHSEARHSIDQDYDVIGVAMAVVVMLALPIFDPFADPFVGLAGGVIGALAGLAAVTMRPHH